MFLVINLLGTLLENQGKCSVFLHITQLLRNICNIMMSQWKDEKWQPKTITSQMKGTFHAFSTVRFAR